MALISRQSLFKCRQLLSDNFVLPNGRSISMFNLLNMNNTVAGQKQESETGEAPPASARKVDDEFEKLNNSITELTGKNSELMDKYKRALADGENLRNRLMKQIADAKIFGIQSFCKDLLDVADVLSKATESVPKEEITDHNPHLKTLYEGLVMTESQLQSVFKRHGLEKVNPLDETFNPNFHEALFQQEVQGKEAGKVVVVSKIGYKLHDRVIRPALVGVSK